MLATLVAFVERYATKADVTALRRLHPGLLTFDAWLDAEGRAKLDALFPAQATASGAWTSHLVSS